MSKGQLRERLPQLLRRKATAPTDSTFQRLRQVRNDKGNAALIGVLIALAITGIMLSVAGPDMLALIRDTRGAKLEQNFATAVSVVENRLRSDPSSMVQGTETYNATTGYLNSGEGLHDALFADGGDFEWHVGWDLPSLGSASDTDIYLQFLFDGADKIAASGVPPEVPWLTSDGTAVRLQAANEDGKWVCALIVNRATVGTETELRTVGTYSIYASNAVTTPVAVGTGVSPIRMNARVSKSWFDSGESYDSDSQLQNCSPVGEIALSSGSRQVQGSSPLPTSQSEWVVPRVEPPLSGTKAPTADILRSNL